MSSPWSRNAASSSPVTLPPAPAPFAVPPSLPPAASGIAPNPHRRWPWAAAALLAVGVSVGTGSAITYLAMHNSKSDAPTRNPPPSTVPQFSSSEVAGAKQHVCHAFELSTGHDSKGGFRVQGQLNVPSTLQSVSSALAVLNALGPADPPEIDAAAHRYIDATLDVTTAAMGGTPTSEVNRLTDISNAALDTLADACGIPR